MATTYDEASIYSDTGETWEDGRSSDNCGRIRVIVHKRQRWVTTPNPYIHSRGCTTTIKELKDAGFRRIHVVNHGIGPDLEG